MLLKPGGTHIRFCCVPPAYPQLNVDGVGFPLHYKQRNGKSTFEQPKHATGMRPRARPCRVGASDVTLSGKIMNLQPQCDARGRCSQKTHSLRAPALKCLQTNDVDKA